MNDLYKVCSNPNDPKDKSLCIEVRDDSPFDGAIVRYTKFKLVEKKYFDNYYISEYWFKF